MSTLIPAGKNGMPPIHPGEIIREEFLKPLNISERALAININFSFSRLHEILNGKVSITVNLAMRLAKTFNTTPQFWINLQNTYDIRKFEINNADDLKDIKQLVK